jgi:uncharacterized protein (TIGR02147 family)
MTEQMAFQAKLRSQLLEAQQKNSAFSLRAFASKLQMSPSALSEILNGKRRVSQQLAEKTLILMGTEPSELAKILRLFEKRDLSISEDKANGSYLELKSDQFQLIAQWYHFAILSLAETKGFKATPLWIAKRLGIKVIEAEQALERLNRLGFIQWSRSQKKLKLMQGQLSTSDDVADAAVRKSHFEDLKLAEETLAKVPVEERDFSSITIAINKNKLSLAKKMIRQFQDQLSAVLEADTKDEVFKFSFYAIPLSKPINET